MPKSSIGQAQAHGTQFLHGRDGLVNPVHDGAFGDFQLQAAGRQACLGEDAAYRLDEFRLAELVRRNIDRHFAHVDALVEPGLDLAAGGEQHPVAERQDQAAFLGDRDELGRANQAALRVAPANQGFDADHLAAEQVDLWLVVQHQLVIGQRAATVRSPDAGAWWRRHSSAR